MPFPTSTSECTAGDSPVGVGLCVPKRLEVRVGWGQTQCLPPCPLPATLRAEPHQLLRSPVERCDSTNQIPKSKAPVSYNPQKRVGVPPLHQTLEHRSVDLLRPQKASIQFPHPTFRVAGAQGYGTPTSASRWVLQIEGQGGTSRKEKPAGRGRG